jgi:predicted acyl esterase
MSSKIRTALLMLVGIALMMPAEALAQKANPIEKRFRRDEVMIPMRDGVRLYTTIFTPRDLSGPLP